MTKPSKSKFSKIDIDKVLRHRRQVAIIWCIEDVQHVRPDLNDAQALEVLIQCVQVHDCEIGFTWDFLEQIAEELFPPRGGNKLSDQGVRP